MSSQTVRDPHQSLQTWPWEADWQMNQKRLGSNNRILLNLPKSSPWREKTISPQLQGLTLHLILSSVTRLHEAKEGKQTRTLLYSDLACLWQPQQSCYHRLPSFSSCLGSKAGFSCEITHKLNPKELEWTSTLST